MDIAQNDISDTSDDDTSDDDTSDDDVLLDIEYKDNYNQYGPTVVVYEDEPIQTKPYVYVTMCQ